MSYPYYYPTSNYPVYSYPPRLYAHEPSLSSNHDSEMMNMGPEHGVLVGTTSGSAIDPSVDPSIPDEPRLPKPPHSETEYYLRRTLGIPEPHPVNLWSLPDSRKVTISEMARLAIWGSPEKRLTLAQIFAAIEARYPHMGVADDKPWQRSIRHNLSLKKIFEKEDRPNDHPGKGNYWALNVRYGETTRKPRKKDGSQGDSQDLASDEESISLPSSTTSSPQQGFYAPYHSESPQPHMMPLNPDHPAMFDSFRRLTLEGRSSMDRPEAVHGYHQPPHAINPMMTMGNYHDNDMRLGPSLQRAPPHALQPGTQAGHSRQNAPMPRRRRSDSSVADSEEGRARGMPKQRRSTD